MNQLVEALQQLTQMSEKMSSVMAEQSTILLAYSRFGSVQDVEKIIRFTAALVSAVQSQPNGQEILIKAGTILLQAQEADKSMKSLEEIFANEDPEWLKSLDLDSTD